MNYNADAKDALAILARYIEKTEAKTVRYCELPATLEVGASCAIPTIAGRISRLSPMFPRLSDSESLLLPWIFYAEKGKLIAWLSHSELSDFSLQPYISSYQRAISPMKLLYHKNVETDTPIHLPPIEEGDFSASPLNIVIYVMHGMNFGLRKRKGNMLILAY